MRAGLVKKTLAIILLLVILALAAVVYWRLNRPAPPGATLLPENTLLFIRIPDCARSRQALEHSQFYALCQEPDVQQFLVQPRRAWQWVLQHAGIHVSDHLLSHVLGALQGEVFLAVTRIGVFGNFQAGVVFGADVKGNLIKTRLALNQAEQLAARRYPGQPIEGRRFLGVNYKVWHKSPNTTICYTFLNSLFVCTWGEDTLRDLITRFTGHGEDASPTLVQSKNYQDFLAQLPPDHDLAAFLNVEPVAALLGPVMLMAPDSASSLQHLTRIRHTGLGLAFRSDTIEEVRVTSYQPNSHPPEAPLERTTLAFTSPQTLCYAVGRTDLANVYDQLLQIVGQVGQAEATAALRAFDRDLHQARVNIQKDVLDHLGPERALIVDWPEGATYPELALVIALRDSAATRPALDKVMTALKTVTLGDDNAMPWDETTAHGSALRTVRIGASRIAPTYTTTDKFFILALTPDGTTELLARLVKPAATLADLASYKTAMRRLPSNGISYLFCDLKALYPHLIGLAQTWIEHKGENPFLDLQKLPSAQTMDKYLSPLASVTTSAAERELTRSFSPIGNPLAIVAWAAGGYALSASPFVGAHELNPPTAPSRSSDRAVPLPPHENRTAGSHTPVTP